MNLNSMPQGLSFRDVASTTLIMAILIIKQVQIYRHSITPSSLILYVLFSLLLSNKRKVHFLTFFRFCYWFDSILFFLLQHTGSILFNCLSKNSKLDIKTKLLTKLELRSHRNYFYLNVQVKKKEKKREIGQVTTDGEKY